ncbi:hypothetical protein [Labrys wisconsinensis]|uniref:Phage abortive infection protein n=1 Tax=Labrys wisconsinensis TaxID=425677 RepID=A0ABU0JEE0_9HYPH|nr:hypothetical protein [Labrys wisconsinensis]MDQ0472647.1 hypothetical protein [Labrys wisconsinensis]
MKNHGHIWSLIAIVLTLIAGYFLGIAAADKNAVDWAFKWQSIFGTILTMAVTGVGAVLLYTQISQDRRIENERRQQRNYANRASLSLALSSISEYCEHNVGVLRKLITQCADGVLSNRIAAKTNFPTISDGTVSFLRDFIEYSNFNQSRPIVKILAELQVLDARLKSMHVRSNSLDRRELILKINIEQYIISNCEIYTYASKLYDFAREHTDEISEDLTTDEMMSSLNNLGFLGDEAPEIRAAIQRLYGNVE